ncbi:hypothetical protein [Microbulbifer litoralis]|uniref:hypothetical protein n=1 Tax=Microbulbifer litoralis TaxID=2933965 RepID=UPI002029569B|nr:hypothetical protein [Microbulbifer sp. GX H0434]
MTEPVYYNVQENRQLPVFLCPATIRHFWPPQSQYLAESRLLCLVQSLSLFIVDKKKQSGETDEKKTALCGISIGIGIGIGVGNSVLGVDSAGL